jgi:hypothetical protein
LLSSGTIGFFHDWFIGPFPEMIFQYGGGGFQIYDINLGNKVYPSDWMFRILFIPFAPLGGEVISKVILILLITLSGFSMFCLGKTLNLGYFSSLISGLIYVFSPIVFTRAIAGHIYYLLGYSLTPFLLVTFIKAQKDRGKILIYSIVSGLILAFVGTQIQFLVMDFAILFTLVLIDYKHLKSGLILLILTLIIGLMMHLPWILPLILVPPASFPPTQTFLAYHEITSSPTLLESIRVVGYKIHPYSYTQLIAKGIIPSGIFIGNFLMPIIAFCALLWKRNKYTIGFAITATIGIFLSKGINPPLEDLFILMFQYTPLVIFRELWHIAFLVFFSYTILVSIAINELTKKTMFKSSYIKNYALAIVLSAIIIVSNGYPLFIGNFANYMQTYSLNEDYRDLIRYFQKDQNIYRILWLPAIAPMRYANNSLYGTDPLISFSPKPAFPQHILPQYPLCKLIMFLVSTIHENKTQEFGNLLSPFATKYVIVRNEFESKYPLYVPLGLYPELSKKWHLSVEQEFIASQNDLEIENETSEFKLYRNINPSEFTYIPTYMIYGPKDLSTLNYLAKIANLTQIAYLTDLSQFEINDPIFLIKDDGRDLIPIITGTKIEPGNYATELDATKGWINSKNWFWYNYLFASTINNGAFSKKTNSKLIIPITTNCSSEIWAKILKWPNGGALKLSLNDKNEQVINTLSGSFSLEWIKLFEVNAVTTHTLTAINQEGENYIDEFLILNREQVTQVIASKLENAKILYLLTPQSFETNIIRNPSFEEISGNYPLFWGYPMERFSATLDNQTAHLGKLSIRVTTQVEAPWHWSWIRSSEYSVLPGKYQIITHMKQENAKASHIVIEGLNKTTGEWSQIIQVPAGQDGSFDWTTYKAVIELDSDITKLRIALNAGWVLNAANGNATTWFDDILIISQHSDARLIDDSSISRNLYILKNGMYKISTRFSGNIEIRIDDQVFYVNSEKYEMFDVGSVFLTKGNHIIQITNQKQQYEWNFSIEDDLYQWKKWTPENQFGSLYALMLDDGTLKAELYNSTWGWKTINSPLISIIPETTYQFDLYIAGENAYGVHVKIAEYDSNKTLLSAKIVSNIGSGNFTWKNINFKFTPSQKTSYIQLQIWHGHETTQPLPNILRIDNVRICKYYGPSDLNVVWIYSTQNPNETIEDIFTEKENPAEIISYNKIDPTKYVVKVNATKPFMLSFAESYDPLWVAYVNGEKIQSTPLYGVINGFYITQTGILEITIEYELQRWFNYGCAISLTTFLVCVAYLTYSWIKDKAIWKRTKSAAKHITTKLSNRLKAWSQKGSSYSQHKTAILSFDSLFGHAHQNNIKRLN